MRPEGAGERGGAPGDRPPEGRATGTRLKPLRTVLWGREPAMSPEVVLEALGQAAARPDGRHARGYPAGGRGRSVRPVGGTGDGHVGGGRRLGPATEPAQQVRPRAAQQAIAI